MSQTAWFGICQTIPMADRNGSCVQNKTPARWREKEREREREGKGKRGREPLEGVEGSLRPLEGCCSCWSAGEEGGGKRRRREGGEKDREREPSKAVGGCWWPSEALSLSLSFPFLPMAFGVSIPLPLLPLPPLFSSLLFFLRPALLVWA